MVNYELSRNRKSKLINIITIAFICVRVDSIYNTDITNTEQSLMISTIL